METETKEHPAKARIRRANAIDALTHGKASDFDWPAEAERVLRDGLAAAR